MKAEITFPPELLDAIADKVIEKLLPLLRHDENEPEDKIMTVKELSSYIGLSSQWIYNNKKDLPHINKKRKPLFRRSDIDEWLKAYHKAPDNARQPVFNPQRNKA